MPIDEAEARIIMATPKFGDPPTAWTQHRSIRQVSLLEFGVTDAAGAAIPGLQVCCRLSRGTRIAGDAWQITLFRADPTLKERVYQIDNPGRARCRPGDHDFPHEHVGEKRQLPDKPAWRDIRFPAMLDIFLERCNLRLTTSIPDVDELRLR